MSGRFVAICSAVALGLSLNGCAKPVAPLSGTALSGPAPALHLQTVRGQPFAFSQEHDRVVVVFFGYTHCPDVCPTTLAHIAAAKAALPAALRSRVTTAFISVDPDRDTIKAADAYAKIFSPDFFGLGGTAAELAAAKNSYHIWSQRLPSTGKSGYAIAHSSAIYVVDGQGEWREILGWDTPASVLRKDFTTLLAS